MANAKAVVDLPSFLAVLVTTSLRGAPSEVENCSAVRTDRGRREFALSVTAHQHPGDAVELEWSLQVRDAEYRKLDAPSYLLHRLQLSNVLELAEPTLKIARADIVSVRREGHTQRLEIDGELHEIRIFARSMRG